jgi:hypothetical protein
MGLHMVSALASRDWFKGIVVYAARRLCGIIGLVVIGFGIALILGGLAVVVTGFGRNVH